MNSSSVQNRVSRLTSFKGVLSDLIFSVSKSLQKIFTDKYERIRAIFEQIRDKTNKKIGTRFLIHQKTNTHQFLWDTIDRKTSEIYETSEKFLNEFEFLRDRVTKNSNFEIVNLQHCIGCMVSSRLLIRVKCYLHLMATGMKAYTGMSTPLRGFQTRLRNLLSKLRFTSKESQQNIDHSFLLAKQGVNNIMNNLNIKVLLSILVGIAFGIFNTINSDILTLVPLVGLITLRFSRNVEEPQLPTPYDGVKDTSKEQYIKSCVDSIDKDEIISKEVTRVTQKAEQEWNLENPHYSRIIGALSDKEYSTLASAYMDSGLSDFDAYKNTLIALIRDEGTLIGDNQYSIDKTLGEFLHHAMFNHDLDDFFDDRSQILNALISLVNNGVTFKTFSEDQEQDYVDLDYDDTDDIDEDSDTSVFDRSDKSTWTEDQVETARRCPTGDPLCPQCSL